jgi:hypothetical protein
MNCKKDIAKKIRFHFKHEFRYKIMSSCWQFDPRRRHEFSSIRQQLALQLEELTDEYNYLKLDAQKDYYNVSYRERAEQEKGEGAESKS